MNYYHFTFTPPLFILIEQSAALLHHLPLKWLGSPKPLFCCCLALGCLEITALHPLDTFSHLLFLIVIEIVLYCFFIGSRSKEASQEIKCTQTLDAQQNGRYMGKKIKKKYYSL